MTVGLIFMYGDAILVYRVFKNVEKLYVKILHACFHMGALIFSSIALRAALDSHDFANPKIPSL
jgi:cytochrome b-561